MTQRPAHVAVESGAKKRFAWAARFLKHYGVLPPGLDAADPDLALGLYLNAPPPAPSKPPVDKAQARLDRMMAQAAATLLRRR